MPHHSRRDACTCLPCGTRAAAHGLQPPQGACLAKDEKSGAAAFPKAAARVGPMLSARVALALAAAAVATATALPVHAADPQRGAELYRTHCAACHGSGGKPVLPGAPDFSRPMALLKPDTVLLASIRQGRGAMPGYAGQLRDRDILDLVSHLRTFR